MGQWKTPTTPSINKNRIFCPPNISPTNDQASAGRRFLNKQMRPCFNQSFKGTKQRSNISDVRWIFPNSITATAPDDPNPMSCHPFALLDPTNDPRSVLDSKKLNVDLDKSLARQSECISAANCTSWFQLGPFCIISGGRQQKIRLSRWAYWNWSI